jgi:hypothetical protein
MRLTNTQKAERILAFLLGLRNVKAIEPMMQHGFDQADVDEGWRLLRGMATYPFEQAKQPVAVDYVAMVDAWENHWFQIIEACLARRFPEVRDRVFANLRQVSGPRVLRSVRTLLERVEALRAGPAQAREAFALLQMRGVTDAMLVEVKAMLDAAERPPPARTAAPPRIDQRAAEGAAWAWYLEWSAIAQKAVSDRRVLRELGYLSHRPLPDDGEQQS